MVSKPHHAHVFTTLEQFIEYKTTYRNLRSDVPETKMVGKELEEATRDASVIWKKHLEKHGHVPLIVQCGVCSGEEYRQNIKHGRWKKPRPNKAERDEAKETEE